MNDYYYSISFLYENIFIILYFSFNYILIFSSSLKHMSKERQIFMLLVILAIIQPFHYIPNTNDNTHTNATIDTNCYYNVLKVA